MQAHQLQSQKQQGLGRGIISSFFAGHRIVAVGAETYYSKNWKTFHVYPDCHSGEWALDTLIFSGDFTQIPPSSRD